VKTQEKRFHLNQATAVDTVFYNDNHHPHHQVTSNPLTSNQKEAPEGDAVIDIEHLSDRPTTKNRARKVEEATVQQPKAEEPALFFFDKKPGQHKAHTPLTDNTQKEASEGHAVIDIEHLSKPTGNQKQEVGDTVQQLKEDEEKSEAQIVQGLLDKISIYLKEKKKDKLTNEIGEVVRKHGSSLWLDPGVTMDLYFDLADYPIPSRYLFQDTLHFAKKGQYNLESELEKEMLKKSNSDSLEAQDMITKPNKRKQKAKTAGPAWYNLPATILDEESKRDLEILQMRNILHPRQFIKSEQEQPTFFEIGTVQNDPTEFYSVDRVKKKNQNKHFVDAILEDHEQKKRIKRKYQTIISQDPRKNYFKRRKSGKINTQSVKFKEKKKLTQFHLSAYMQMHQKVLD